MGTQRCRGYECRLGKSCKRTWMAFITWVEGHISLLCTGGESLYVFGQSVPFFFYIYLSFFCKTGLIILWELLGDELMVGSGLYCRQKNVYIFSFSRIGSDRRNRLDFLNGEFVSFKVWRVVRTGFRGFYATRAFYFR